MWLIHEYGLSEAGGNTALAAMLIAGACGTLVGGRIVDRVGRRRVLIGSTLAQIPLLIGFMLAPSGLVAGVLMAGIGFVTVMSFSVSVVMGQEYLPSRLGIASGRHARAGDRHGRRRGGDPGADRRPRRAGERHVGDRRCSRWRASRSR